jgi:D-sedoheptulose 7-phosphate isomerase
MSKYLQENLLVLQDLVMCSSPSPPAGIAPSILADVVVAKELGIITIAMTGSGGQLKSMCESICIPSPDTARIQECHIMVGHILCGLVEKAYFQTNLTV